jgi:tRNA-dihydrouridine synthase B
LLLAPMEGITDPLFRSMVIALGGVGGACTEFIRISNAPVPARVVQRNLGPSQEDVPVGVQFMAADTQHLPRSIQAAEQAGATWIDLNFGCPVPVVFNKCAGSALLGQPKRLGEIVASAVASTRLPVSAKIRAGIDDPSCMDEVVAAVVEAGAAMLTVHARLRCQAYSQPATWSWIARACELVARSGRRIPVIGNGAVETASDVRRMRDETGCDGVMIGRGALFNPWIFLQAQGGMAASPHQAASFALRYAQAIESGQSARAALGKLKQLIRWYQAGGLFTDEPQRRVALLRAESLDELRGWLSGFLEAQPIHLPAAQGVP